MTLEEAIEKLQEEIVYYNKGKATTNEVNMWANVVNALSNAAHIDLQDLHIAGSTLNLVKITKSD